MAGNKSGETAIVVGKTYDFLLWLLPKVEKFPRSYRFSVGERLTACGLDLLLSLVEASYSSSRSVQLEAAVRQVNSVRYLIRFSKDLKLLSVKSYEFAAAQLEEIGRMVGGWRKTARTQA